MENLNEIELFDCPICHGTGVLEEENGWCLYVTCLDCGAHTAEIPYKTEAQRLDAAKAVARTWNMGKVIAGTPGE